MRGFWKCLNEVPYQIIRTGAKIQHLRFLKASFTNNPLEQPWAPNVPQITAKKCRWHISHFSVLKRFLGDITMLCGCTLESLQKVQVRLIHAKTKSCIIFHILFLIDCLQVSIIGEGLTNWMDVSIPHLMDETHIC